MTTLIKNWNYIIVPAGTGSALATQESVSTVTYPVGDYVGDALPIIQTYPIY